MNFYLPPLQLGARHLLSQESLLWLGISIGQQQDRQGILVTTKRATSVWCWCGVYLKWTGLMNLKPEANKWCSKHYQNVISFTFTIRIWKKNRSKQKNWTPSEGSGVICARTWRVICARTIARGHVYTHSVWGASGDSGHHERSGLRSHGDHIRYVACRPEHSRLHGPMVIECIFCCPMPVRFNWQSMTSLSIWDAFSLENIQRSYSLWQTTCHKLYRRVLTTPARDLHKWPLSDLSAWPLRSPSHLPPFVAFELLPVGERVFFSRRILW